MTGNRLALIADLDSIPWAWPWNPEEERRSAGPRGRAQAEAVAALVSKRTRVSSGRWLMLEVVATLERRGALRKHERPNGRARNDRLPEMPRDAQLMDDYGRVGVA
jgi:hypothetical protein